MTNTWKIINRGLEEKIVLFDQPITPGYRLAEPVKAEQEIEGHYRFRVAVKTVETKEFKVIEKMDVYQSINLKIS